MDAKDLFLAELPLIERVIAAACRRHVCFGAEAEDFASAVKEKLIENDYAVLRKFRGEGSRCSLKAYLATVVKHAFRDYLIAKRGKWRPSVAAKRLDTVGVQLETLLYRDGYSLDEAIGILQRNFHVDLSAEELTEMAECLKPRPGRRVYESDESPAVKNLADPAGTERVESRLEDRDHARTADRTERALEEALSELDDEDQALLRLHYLEGLPFSQIARAMKVPQRQLYSRKDRCLKGLRASLERSGLDKKGILALLDWEKVDLLVFRRPTGKRPTESV